MWERTSLLISFVVCVDFVMNHFLNFFNALSLKDLSLAANALAKAISSAIESNSSFAALHILNNQNNLRTITHPRRHAI